jgi:hypothetical protein
MVYSKLNCASCGASSNHDEVRDTSPVLAGSMLEIVDDKAMRQVIVETKTLQAPFLGSDNCFLLSKRLLVVFARTILLRVVTMPT